MSHRHYCNFRRHLWQHEGTVDHCFHHSVMICEPCNTQKFRISTFIVPIICILCGVAKRGPDGRALYVDYYWQKSKRMVCPDCQQSEVAMKALSEMVAPDEDDDVPF